MPSGSVTPCSPKNSPDSPTKLTSRRSIKLSNKDVSACITKKPSNRVLIKQPSKKLSGFDIIKEERVSVDSVSLSSENDIKKKKT